MKDNPCKNCTPPKRNPVCHIHCDEYIKWRKEHDALQKIARANIDAQNSR